MFFCKIKEYILCMKYFTTLEGIFMKTKNFFVIISIFVIFICCVGAISAASEDVMNNTVSETDSFEETVSISNDEQAKGVDSSETATGAESNNNDMTNDEKIAVSEDGSTLTKDQSDDKLSISAHSNFYTIKLKGGYQISSYSQGSISGTITPPPSYLPGYSFKLYVYDLDEKLVWSGNTFTGYGTSFTQYIPAKSILPGLYTMYAINDYDGVKMAESVLGVGGQIAITANNYDANYMSGNKITVKVTDKVSGKPLRNVLMKVTYANGKTSVSEEFVPDSNGQYSFEPSVGIGTWTVTISSDTTGVTGSVVKTAVIKKSAVSISASKVTEYKGFKTTLKAVVKSNGKKVNEGTVTFKINGKSYKAAVKNGVATVKVSLTKLKTYKYTAVFSGDNFKTSKKVTSTAVLKQPSKTKINFPNQVVYVDSSRIVTVTVKTTSGKNVANGKLKIVGGGETQYTTVKNGKAKIKVEGLYIMKHFVGFTSSGETYKKSITKKFKVSYVPASHKYKSTSKTVKVTSKFKCLCGKTSTHTHRAWSGSYYYNHIISVK